MNLLRGTPRDPRRVARVALALVALIALSGAGRAAAAPPPPFAARSGLDLVRDAARAWADDAALIYVENDDSLDAGGNAARWGYLFYSPGLDQARVYSVRGGRIVVADRLDMKFQAPPLTGDWIDSPRALEAADQRIGGEFRRRHHGTLHTMLLVRGALQDGDPDAACWMLIYRAPDEPALFVVVDASDGAVRRTWRG
jgi:hypothetical protein